MGRAGNEGTREQGNRKLGLGEIGLALFLMFVCLIIFRPISLSTASNPESLKKLDFAQRIPSETLPANANSKEPVSLS